MTATQSPMKTAFDIRTAFEGAQTVTSGGPTVWKSKVTLSNGETLTGWGSSLESAEDTAFYGSVITLRA